MQILVFIVLAVIYALGSILKAKSSKTEQEKEEPLTPKPPRKPPERKRRPQKQLFQQPRQPARPQQPSQPQPQIQPPRRKVIRPEPVVRKPPTKMKELTPLPAIEMPEVSETLQKMEAKPPGVAAAKPVLKDVSQPVLDYTDADELTRAILHYEILGRPLSLRKPSERIIGL